MQKNKQMQKNKRQNVKNVRSVIRQTVTGYAGLLWIRSPQETQFRLQW